MEFASPLLRGTLVRRYARFLADVELSDGRVVSASCPNTGAMTGLSDKGMAVYLSHSASSSRKYAHTWEITDRPGYGLIGINTGRPNHLVAKAVAVGRIGELAGYDVMRREVRYGQASRVDLLLEHPARAPCYVEVKNVTLFRKPGLAEFPDCPTARGTRHLSELSAMVKSGHRAVMVYCIQGGSAQAFAPTPDIDPDYDAAFRKARACGVEAIAVTCHVGLDRIEVTGTVPVLE